MSGTQIVCQDPLLVRGPSTFPKTLARRTIKLEVWCTHGACCSCAENPRHPFLLEKQWFPYSNASNLRSHLRVHILELFKQQNPGHTALEEADAEIMDYMKYKSSKCALL